MEKSVKSVFEDVCGHVKIDAKLIKKVHNYVVGFVNKNEDHVAFFGSNLLGVHPVRFRDADTVQWFDEVLEVDDILLKTKLHSLANINPDFHVSSNVMNLSCAWLLHAFYASTTLTQKDKDLGMIDTMLVLQYKLLSSMLAHFFRYPADREVAEATYAQLTKKYALKVHGSWGKLLVARSEDIIAPGSIHYTTYTRFDDDISVVEMLNDIQGRLKSILKNMRAVFEQVRLGQTKVKTTSSVVEINGVSVVRDKTGQYDQFRRYLHSVANNSSNLIKPELVTVVADAMHTMPERLLRETLEYMATNYSVPREKDIAKLMDETLLHAFDVITNNREIMTRVNDLPFLLGKLRAIYMSSRSTDASLMLIRDIGERLVTKATKVKNPGVIASIRTGVLLYLVLRTLTMKHYS